MKMKKILVSMFLLFFALCLKANVSNAAETDVLNRWDLSLIHISEPTRH